MNRIEGQFTDPFCFALYAQMIDKRHKLFPAVVDGAANLSVAH